jgi:hypothetical protein
MMFLPFCEMQGQTLKEITDKYLKYCREVPREEVYLHTDRTDYIAGEELWFSAYLYDRQSSKPDYNSSIIYVEVLNSENHPVGQKRVRAVKGFGPGEIILPDTLATGCYTLRAYTGWMKNFLPSNCFVRKIHIYNALNTVNGISCQPQQPPVRSDNSNSGPQAPFSVAVDNHKGDDVEIAVSASDTYRAKNKNLCYIFVETHGIINHTGVINLSFQNNKYVVPAKDMTAGINHITFFDNKGEPLAEKYIYTRSRKNNYLTISAPDSCRKREKISLGLDVAGMMPFVPDSSNVSISVTPVDKGFRDEIGWYMVFGSEFGPLPDNISGMNPDEIPSDLLENFLSSVRSNWIDWDMILSGQTPDMENLAEKESQLLSGALFNKNTHQPVPDKILFLSIPGKNASFQYAVTDRKGVFKFIIPVTELEQDLIIQPEENDKNNSIEILSSFTGSYPVTGYGSSVPEKNIPPLVAKWSANYQVNRIYGIGVSSAPEKSLEKMPERKRFYGKPDIGLVLDDYIKLPVMQEVFFELLPGVSLKSRKDVYKITIIDPVDNRVQKRPPVLLIDGVIINDATVIANLDPEIVERIDVIEEKYFVGDYIFYGLINVITRAGDFSCASIPDQALRLKYKAIDQELSFTEPEFSLPDKGLNNIPDFRNTLYWNPSLTRGKDGKYTVNFRASDLTGEYEINIQGLTSDGQPVSARKTFRIN